MAREWYPPAAMSVTASEKVTVTGELLYASG